tara:strand:+ start:630 stop:968 length:339 start_codon:yes stop_codon:yes gene_type:complete
MKRVHTFLDGTTREYTDAENKVLDDAKDANRIYHKLQHIKLLRKRRLEATDHLALGDRTMSDAMKTWRQTLRDLPQNNTTEAEYDALLEVDDGEGKQPPFAFKHSVWKEPSS